VSSIGHRRPILDTSDYYQTPMFVVTGMLPVVTTNYTECVLFRHIVQPLFGCGLPP